MHGALRANARCAVIRAVRDPLLQHGKVHEPKKDRATEHGGLLGFQQT